jgi:hypothetical protein
MSLSWNRFILLAISQSITLVQSGTRLSSALGMAYRGTSLIPPRATVGLEHSPTAGSSQVAVFMSEVPLYVPFQSYDVATLQTAALELTWCRALHSARLHLRPIKALTPPPRVTPMPHDQSRKP